MRGSLTDGREPLPGALAHHARPQAEGTGNSDRDDELADLVRLVVLRDRLLAETGKDIIDRTRVPVLPVLDPQTGTAMGRLPVALVPGSHSTPSGCCSTSGSSISCPARAVRSRSPNDWPRCVRPSARR